MFTYTHVTRIGTGKDASGKSTYKVVTTDNVQIPVTLDDIRSLLADSNYNRMVKVTLNESGGEHKQVVEMPFICKLLANSIGLAVNAKARQGEGVDPLKLASDVLANGSAEAKAEAIKAMAAGKAALKAWAEAYAETQDELE
jgi:hypothetical protein